MKVVEIKGTLRKDLGKKASKLVRKEEKVPCVIYGGEEPIHFTADVNSFRSLIYNPDFKLAEIVLDNGKTVRCILKESQFHPVTDQIVHLDFIELVPNKVVKVEIPVRFKGTSPGVKLGGKLIQSLRRVKVKTTPEKLVDELLLDISTLQLGHSIRIRDIEVGEGIEIMNSPGIPVASVEIPRALKSATAAAEKEEEEDVVTE